VRITELATLCLIDRTALSRNLEPLAAQGLVAVVAGRDARTREATLTRAGRAALERALPYWRRAQSEVAQRLGERKIDALVGLLATVEELHPAPEPRGD
jgi:DNA-binding MarR family transcriptional regulator